MQNSAINSTPKKIQLYELRFLIPRPSHLRLTAVDSCLGTAPSDGRCTDRQSGHTTDHASCGLGHHGTRLRGGQTEFGKTSAGCLWWEHLVWGPDATQML